MMKTLVIDIGNTNLKFGYFNDQVLEETLACPISEWSLIEHFFQNKIIQKALIAASGEIPEVLTDLLKISTIPFLLFHTQLKFSFINKYKTPETLGHDRLALMEGAFVYYGAPALVIACGTCITYNLLNERGEMLGGAISPGLEMRLKSMADYTARLPRATIPSDLPPLIGQTTESCLQSGAVHGALVEIDGIIEQYLLIYPHLNIILTGGDADYLESKLKNKIFADNHIILKGLNAILLHNEF